MPQSPTVPTPASDPGVVPAHRPAPRDPQGPFLAATDGTEASAAVLAVAKLLAGSADEVRIVSIVEPAPVMMPPAEVPVYTAAADEARAQALRHRLGRQARDLFGDAPPAPTVLIGSPVELLAREAREQHAAMVITGMRHHGRLDRLMLHRETPLGIARTGRVPVLVVPQETTRLPRIALVAADTDDASVNAARRARPLLADAEKVYVIHVRRGGSAPSDAAAVGWERFYTQQTQFAFDRIVAALDLPTTVRVETRTISGHPVEELLDFAEFARVELIVAGYRKRLLIDRLAGPPSVAERVFRGAACAMLLVPEVAGVELPFALAAETEVIADRATWPLQLAAFTYRNAGRRARLEVDTLDLGSQAQVDGFPLLGADYDPSAETIRLTFGAAEEDAPHLSHGIPRPASVEIQRLRDGKDLALRVAHEGGYSLVTFREPVGAGKATG